MSARKNTLAIAGKLKRRRADDADDADTVPLPPTKQLQRSSSVESDGWPSPAFKLDSASEPAPVVIDLSDSDDSDSQPGPVPVLLSPEAEAEAQRRAVVLLCWTKVAESRIIELLGHQFNPSIPQQASDTLREAMQELDESFWEQADALPQTSVDDVTSYSKMTPAQLGDLPRWEQMYAEAHMLFDERFDALAQKNVELLTLANAYPRT
jgi:hypothetical protein